jgi:tetratricopeptide (TPR) repeat protein
MSSNRGMLTTWRASARSHPCSLIRRGLDLAIELDSDIQDDGAAVMPMVTALAPIPRQPSREKATVIQSEPARSAGPPVTDWAEVWLQRGHHKVRLGDYAGALENYDQALQKRPHMVAAHNGRGNIFYAQQAFKAARLAFGQALALQPDCAHIHCNIGSTLLCLGDLVGAIASYQAAIGFNNRYANAYYGLGAVLHQQRQYLEASKAYQQAIDLAPRHAESYYGLGCVCYELKDRQSAIDALRKAMQCDPRYTEAYLMLQLHRGSEF